MISSALPCGARGSRGAHYVPIPCKRPAQQCNAPQGTCEQRLWQFPTDLRPAPFIKVLAAFGAISEIAFPVMLALGSNVGHSVGVAGLLVRE